MMHGNLEYIAEHYTLDELEKLKSLLGKLQEKKKAELQSSITLYKFSQEYQNYIKITFSSKYLESVKLSMKHLIEFFNENKMLVEISQKEVEDFKANIINRAPKGFTVYMRTIKAAFNIAVDWEYITNNPFRKVKFKKTQKMKPIFIGPDELQIILQNTESEIMKNIFIFAFNTGCRLGEIINLRWKNINIEDGTIIIGDEIFRTKTNKQRVIPLSMELRKVLRKIILIENNILPEHNVFSKDNGFPYNGEYISRCFKKSCRKAGLSEEIHFHTLRHSFASHLALKNVPLITIKELLGHSSIVTTEIYSHTNLKSLKEAIQHFEIA